MTHSTTCRVSPQASPGALSVPTNPSQQLSCLDDNDGVVRVISNGRILCPYPAAKAWVSDAVPPADPAPSDDFSVPATATWVYRQRRDFGDEGETSALLAWLAALLCLPRLGSGRLRSPASRENSVDFVTTWQKAQAEAAARRVVPVLKRASELTPPAPNSPEPFAPGDQAQPLVARGPTSPHGSMTFARPDSRLEDGNGNGRSHSYAPSTQRPTSCLLPPIAGVPSGDLVQYMADDLELPPPNSRASSRPDSCQAAASGGQVSKRSVRFG